MNKMFRHSVVKQYSALLPCVTEVARILSEEGQGTASVVFDIDDTLIFDDEHQTPNVQVKHLLDVARAFGCKVHLVTAREKSAEVTKWTEDELRKHGIEYDSLALAPKSSRASMKLVALWKFKQRAKNKPVLVSIGDQWGDSLLLTSETDIELLDAAHKTEQTPWVIVRPNDGVTAYGVKLMA